jgi:hypothetical protein
LKTANGSIIPAGTVYDDPIPAFIMKRLAKRQATITVQDPVKVVKVKKEDTDAGKVKHAGDGGDNTAGDVGDATASDVGDNTAGADEKVSKKILTKTEKKLLGKGK